MDLIQQKFVSVFSAYQVNTQARPDGGVLLTLRAPMARLPAGC
jgi:hypothetical protein